MRRSLPLLNLALASLVFTLPSAAQAPRSGDAQDLQGLTAAYNQALQARDWQGAVAAAQKLVEASASSLNLRLLADVQLSSGAAQESLATYDRALAAAERERPAQSQPLGEWKDGVGKIWASKGNALLKLHRDADAIDAYNRWAALSSNPGRALFNICAVFYNTGNTHEAAAACRSCLQADPSKADAWFILGSALFADATVDAKGKAAISAETRHALEKYLELAPDGPHAADVKAMLDMAAK
ncbi:MAG: hypothetical protein P4L26_04755 [Terracidiphilus sp.]|nr:hypothetical protein [Terracidiphilus sp.]